MSKGKYFNNHELGAIGEEDKNYSEFAHKILTLDSALVCMDCFSL